MTDAEEDESMRSGGRPRIRPTAGGLAVAAALLVAVACGGTGDDEAAPATSSADTVAEDDGTAGDGGAIEVAAEDLEALLGDLRTEVDEGVVETGDDDGDGVADRATLSFAPVDTGTATITRSVELVEGESATITVRLDGDGPYEHVEVIPKSFATDVAQIAFSVEPDEVIDPDPHVKWLDGIIARSRGELTMTIAWDALASGTGPDLTDAMKNFDDIRFQARLEAMKAVALKQHGFVDVIDLFDVIAKYPDKFELDDCSVLYDYDMGGDWLFACRAVVSGNIGECDQSHQVIDQRPNPLTGKTEYYTATPKAKAEQSCRYWAALARYGGCLSYQGLERDTCIRDACVWSRTNLCHLIGDTVTYQTCMAGLTQDDEHCRTLARLGGVATVDDLLACCDAITDEAARSRCRAQFVEEAREAEEAAVGNLDITYEPYDEQLETGKDYTFSFGLDPPRDGTIYRIEFGDGVEFLTYEPTSTYHYDDQGIYDIRVQARDEIDDHLVASGSLRVETSYPYGRLELLQATTQVTAQLTGRVSRGTNESIGTFVAAESLWNGRQFSARFEGKVGDNPEQFATYRIDGVVDQDATVIENITVTTIRRIGAVTTESTFSASGLPLEPDRPIPTVRTDDARRRFDAHVEGSSTSRYVDASSIVVTTAEGTTDLGPLSFGDGFPSAITITFSLPDTEGRSGVRGR